MTVKRFMVALLAAAPLLAFAQGTGSGGGGAGARTGTDIWARWRAQRDFYQRKHPCPVNGKKVGNCPGYRIGLVVLPRNGGAIDQDNMRWMTDQEYDQTQQNMPLP